MTERHCYSSDYFRQREQSPTFQLEVSAFERELESTLHRRGRVVEAGAGSGVLALTLADGGADMVAADIDMEPLRHLATEPIRLLRCDVSRLPIASTTADGIVAQHVIEHFPNPVSVLTEWRRVLKPGGICVVTTPNRFFPEPSWFDDPTHDELFDAERLRAAFDAAGFRRVRVRPLVPWLGSMRAIFFAARLQRSLLALPVRSRRSLNILGVGFAPTDR